MVQGMISALPNATIMDLTEILEVTYEQISTVLVAKSIGIMVGSIVGNYKITIYTKGPVRQHYWGGEAFERRRQDSLPRGLPDSANSRRGGTQILPILGGGHPDSANSRRGAPRFCQFSEGRHPDSSHP